MVKAFFKLVGIGAIAGGSVFIAKELLTSDTRNRRAYNRKEYITNESYDPKLDVTANMWKTNTVKDDNYQGYITKIKQWIPGFK